MYNEACGLKASLGTMADLGSLGGLCKYSQKAKVGASQQN